MALKDTLAGLCMLALAKCAMNEIRTKALLPMGESIFECLTDFVYPPRGVRVGDEEEYGFDDPSSRYDEEEEENDEEAKHDGQPAAVCYANPEPRDAVNKAMELMQAQIPIDFEEDKTIKGMARRAAFHCVETCDPRSTCRGCKIRLPSKMASLYDDYYGFISSVAMTNPLYEFSDSIYCPECFVDLDVTGMCRKRAGELQREREESKNKKRSREDDHEAQPEHHWNPTETAWGNGDDNEVVLVPVPAEIDSDELVMVEDGHDVIIIN